MFDNLTHQYINVPTKEIIVNYSLTDRIIFGIVIVLCIKLGIRQFYIMFPEVKKFRDYVFWRIKTCIKKNV